MSFQVQTGALQINAEPPTTDVANPTGFTRVDCAHPFAETPVVIAMVQSFNGEDTPGLRLREVSRTGFEIRMNELVNRGNPLGPISGHTTETIAWVALQS